jgi:hypothetical protein
VTDDALASATKDELVLTMLAVMGGESRAINERDLFLTCWHAVPNAMRWVDTPLPNPDTFTAAMRRLDQRGYIERIGKQERQGKRSRSRRKTVLDAPGKVGVVKARIAADGLERAGIGPELVEGVRQLLPDNERTKGLSDAAAIATCVRIREQIGRDVDEGALVEVAFHRFPGRFAYEQRREFPDLARIRTAIGEAQGEGYMDEGLRLTDAGRSAVAEGIEDGELRADASQAPAVGELRLAARIEGGEAYAAYAENGTLVKTKPDELYRALRIPPTTDPRPVAQALRARIRALRRIDKGEVVDYLLAIAARHNEDALDLLREEEPHALNSVPGEEEDDG